MDKKAVSHMRAVRLFAVSFLLNECYAMLVKGKLGQVTGLPEMSPIGYKPSVYLDLSSRKAVGTSGQASEDGPSLLMDEAVWKRFKEAVARVSEQSGIFESFTFDPIHAQTMDYTFRIELSETKENHSALRVLLTLPSWACLGLGITAYGVTLPTPFDSTLTLTASVQDRDGADLGSYKIEESVIWWCGASLLFLAPIAGHNDLRLWENMIKVLYTKILNDHSWSRTRSGKAPRSGGR